MKPSIPGHSRPRKSGSLTSAWLPPCDVFEDKDAVKIVAEILAWAAEDAGTSLEHNVLTVRGEKKQQAEEKTERVHRYERNYGSVRADLRSADEGRPGADRRLRTLTAS